MHRMLRAAVLAAGVVLVEGALVCAITGTFPTVLYRFVPRAGQVTKPDFDEAAQQLAATQERLGVGMANMPTAHTPSLVLVEDGGLSDQRIVPPFFRAPKPGRVTEATCLTRGGSSSSVSLELSVVQQGAATVAAILGCAQTEITAPLNISMPTGAMLSGRLLSPLGVPTAVSALLTFTPGS